MICGNASSWSFKACEKTTKKIMVLDNFSFGWWIYNGWKKIGWYFLWIISSQRFRKSDYLLSCIAIVVGASQDAPFKPLSPLSFSEDTSNRAFLQNCGKMILNFWIRPLALKLNLVSATNSWLDSFKPSLLSRLAKYLSPPHHSTQSSTLHLVWGRMYEYAKFLLCFLNKVKSTCLL